MDGNRRWLGWVAIGLGALALAVALLGRGFGSQFGPQGGLGANVQPNAGQQQNGWTQNSGPGANAQQNAQPQRGRGMQPGANAQPNSGQQSDPSANAQQNAQPQRGRGMQQNDGPRGGPAGPDGEARHGGGRPGAGGFGIGGWLRMPFRLIGGSFQWAMLALLIGLGVWMLRRRTTVAAPAAGPAEPAQAPSQAPLSPTGEAYIEEPSEEE